MIPDRSFFDMASWYRAMTLAERAGALRCVQEEPAELPVGMERAQRRLERWRMQEPFGDEALFLRRLSVDGLTEPSFLRILGEPIEGVALRSSTKAPWLVALERALLLPRSDAPLPLPPKFESAPTRGFLELVRPLMDEGRARLREAAGELALRVPEPPFDPATVDALLAPSMADPLLRMMMRTMVLELNVARVQGVLSGDTPGDRFNDFVARMCRRDVGMAIFLEYPVLARQLVCCVDQWVERGKELLSHLIADGPAIRALFSPGVDPGPLVGFAGNAGDRHRDGRAVGIVTFRSGLKLVYKPQSLAVHAHFQELLGWLNNNGADPPFRTILTLSRRDHGWMEFVEREPCMSVEAVERFYARQGENLALLYVLGATDFHHENLIAAGEHPVLVDLEALFHPLFVDELSTSLTLKESLFRTNLLPMRSGAGGDYAGMDISGLGSPEGQLTEQKVQDWDDPFQDSMRFVRRRLRMRGADNQPTLGGRAVEGSEHIGTLRAGFDSMYALLSRRRDALLATDGPIARFACDETRIVMRHTRAYMFLLSEAFHPDALRDALERDCILDHLWALTAKAPYLLHFVECERASLARYDIPLFATRPSSMDIVSDSGARITGIIAESGQDRTKRRLLGLDASDQARQRWCIDAAFASMADGDPSGAAFSGGSAVSGALPGGAALIRERPLRDRLLDAARGVGDRLATLAFSEGEIVGWNILRQIDERYWTIASTGLDLYGGLPGIALFLAYLERLTGDDRHAALTRGVVSTMRRAIAETRKTFKSIGGFDGWGGVLYALTSLAWALDDRSLLAEAESIVEFLPDIIAHDEGLDVISGAAGCIGGLLCLHRASPSPRTLAAAVACGERLLERSQAMEQGVGWRTPIAREQPLCGLSHGAAGIAWALLELATITGETRFRTTAEQAFTYERSQFSPAVGTWLDLRRLKSSAEEAEAVAPPRLTTAWCHGAPGIGLVRLRALAHSDDPALREEVALAVAATVRSGFGHNHSLCHGDLGNIELLLQASAALPDDAPARAVLERLQDEIIDSIAREGFRCATPRSVETAGLMLGLAGIGYGLLRLADPARVPSVLLLEGPLQG